MGIGQQTQQLDSMGCVIRILPDNKTKQNILNDFCTSPPPERDKFYFQDITPIDVKKALKHIKSKTQGTDDISNHNAKQNY